MCPISESKEIRSFEAFPEVQPFKSEFQIQATAHVRQGMARSYIPFPLLYHSLFCIFCFCFHLFRTIFVIFASCKATIVVYLCLMHFGRLAV